MIKYKFILSFLLSTRYYQEFEAEIAINDLKILNGNLPPKAHGMIIEWANSHRNELMDNWNRIQAKLPPMKIKPLE